MNTTDLCERVRRATRLIFTSTGPTAERVLRAILVVAPSVPEPRPAPLEC